MPRPRWEPPTVPFTAAQVPAAHSTIRRALARGALVRLGGGVLIAAAAVPDDPILRHGLAALAWQMRRPGCVASHETAALVAGLPLLSTNSAATSPPRFTRAAEPGVRGSSTPRTTVRPLPGCDVSEVADGVLAGLRFTTAERTAIDMAVEVPLPQALMLTDAVARRAVLAGLRGRNPRGHLGDDILAAARAPLRQACLAAVHRRAGVQRAIALADPRRESPAESCSFGHMVAAGLPTPDCQHAVTTRLGVVYPDFWWQEYGLAGECDGRSKYGADDSGATTALMAEGDRQHALVEQGIDVVRWRAIDILRQPDLVLAKISAHLSARGWDGKRVRG